MKLIIFLICALWVSGTQAQETYSGAGESFKITEIASGFEYPWGMAFFPNGDALITEREGALKYLNIDTGELRTISGLPDNIYVAGQGGLLDAAVHPDFAENNLVYFSYAGRDKKGLAGTEVARATLQDHQLINLETIFIAAPKTRGTLHYGSRLLFLPDGTLLATIGERYTEMQEAQNLKNHLGSVIRINDDGSIPADNPFVNHVSARPEIYTYGHRNPQGLALHPETNEIWLHEHGPKGGDEINILEPGANYGWPKVTFGIDYSGAIISEKTTAPGITDPLLHWTPSIAPSGMAFYTGNDFPAWQSDLFVGALVKRHLRYVDLEDGSVAAQETLLDGYGRIRDVTAGADGHLYLLTDDLNGQLLRIDPQ